MTGLRATVRASVVIVMVAVSVAGAEVVTRRLDGYALGSFRLIRLRRAAVPLDDVTRAYAARVPVGPGIDRRWFAEDPGQPSGGSSTADPDLARRYWSHKGLEFSGVYEWNANYLRAAACSPDAPRYRNALQTIFPVKEVFVFEPPDHAEYPRYRYLRSARYPSGLMTNDFGWRGPDIALTKPPDTIRIAFVGASTTAGPHSYRYSYPDYVRHWLERWAGATGLPVHFEIINAGREGIDSTSIAAIVRDELVPLEPDLVVYYEGANQFGLADYIVWPGGVNPGRPARTTPWPLEDRSALVARLRRIRDPFIARRTEPRKPSLPVAWPQGLDELDPELDHPRLTLELPTIMRDLDAMRASLSQVGGQLAVSSFVWCVRPGMEIDPLTDPGVYGYLNDMFWPFSYAYIRRLADFQNRVFRKYARARGIDFIDVANSYPIDPRLFIDGVHMTENGTKLMAWIVLQQLVPIVDKAIARGELPQPARHRLMVHPDFEGPARRVVSVDGLRASCTKS